MQDILKQTMQPEISKLEILAAKAIVLLTAFNVDIDGARAEQATLIQQVLAESNGSENVISPLAPTLSTFEPGSVSNLPISGDMTSMGDSQGNSASGVPTNEKEPNESKPPTSNVYAIENRRPAPEQIADRRLLRRNYCILPEPPQSTLKPLTPPDFDRKKNLKIKRKH